MCQRPAYLQDVFSGITPLFHEYDTAFFALLIGRGFFPRCAYLTFQTAALDGYSHGLRGGSRSF